MSRYVQSEQLHKSAVDASSAAVADDDDWDTDPDYVNDISEKDQRKGSKIIQPEEDSAAINLNELKNQVAEADANKERVVHSSQKHTYGSGAVGSLNN